MKKLTSNRLLWPAVVLIALLLANLLWNHSFFDITVRDGNLYGAPVDILRRAAPIVLVALGMTLVIATRGHRSLGRCGRGHLRLVGVDVHHLVGRRRLGRRWC